jgi:hypothetical protein
MLPWHIVTRSFLVLRAVRNPNQISYTKFKMDNKKDELHADIETVETVPVKKAISEKMIEL